MEFMYSGDTAIETSNVVTKASYGKSNAGTSKKKRSPDCVAMNAENDDDAARNTIIILDSD